MNNNINKITYNSAGGMLSKCAHEDKIYLIDGTLREGEQSAGVFFTFNEKVKLIKLMDRAGIDIADCGMPAVSKDEFISISKLASLKNIAIKIGASVRCLMPEIKLFTETGASECFIIVPVSDIHIKEKFKMGRSEYVEYVKNCVKYADELKINGIHIAFEDMSRTGEDFFLKLIRALCDLKISRLRAFYLCDTIGIALPEKINLQAAAVIKTINEIDKSNLAGLGIHCHNDYGLALANTLSAFDAGARYLTFTQNGIGERAGNVKYHELVMTLINLKKQKLNVDISCLPALSKMTEKISGIFVSAIEPVVGYNVFRHESGIHVSGLLRDRKLYEEYRPEEIGRGNEFVLGKHTGTALINKLLNENFNGIKFSGAEISKILNMVKTSRITYKKKEFGFMARSISTFNKKALGGVKLNNFIKIVKTILNKRNKNNS